MICGLIEIDSFVIILVLFNKLMKLLIIYLYDIIDFY